MRQSFLFKVFFLVLFISSGQLIFAQNSTKTSSKTHNSTSVEINTSKNQKLSLKDNNDRLNISLRFEKEHTNDVREILIEELGRTNSIVGKKQVWTSKNEAYTFELKEGYLYVNIIKDQLGKSEYNALENLGKATIELAGFHIDLDGQDGHFNIHIN